MDDHRFDTLTRFFGDRLNRRSVTAALAAVIGGVAALDEGDAAPAGGEVCLHLGKRCKGRPFRCCGKATCRQKKCRCPKGLKSCQGQCIKKNACCRNRDCGRNAICHPNGTCQCPPGLRACRGDCLPADACCTNADCEQNDVCVDGACVAACGNGGSCLAFVTSENFTGALGGVAGANGHCARLAGAAELPGSYLAWISDNLGNSPSANFSQNAGPYVLTNGTEIAGSWADLTSGRLAAPINITEQGNQPSGPPFVWSDTRASGATIGSPVTCQNWTSAEMTDSAWVGSFRAFETDDWTFEGSVSCNVPYRLYCFQQP